MPFDQNTFQQMLDDYLTENVTIKIVDYTGDTNPIGGASLGVNVDVGETNSFDLRFTNNGNLGLLNVIVRVTSRRGRVSQNFSGLVNLAGSQWMAPWSNSMEVRPFNLAPNQTYLHRHAMSGGNLFGYVADEPTGGTDNNRDVETLLTATIIQWQPDMNNFILNVTKGPQDIWRNFIQRS